MERWLTGEEVCGQWRISPRTLQTPVSYTHLDVYKRQVRAGRLGGVLRFSLLVLCYSLRGGSRRHSRNILCDMHLWLG